jgi:hypothetical protein
MTTSERKRYMRVLLLAMHLSATSPIGQSSAESIL